MCVHQKKDTRDFPEQKKKLHKKHIKKKEKQEEV